MASIVKFAHYSIFKEDLDGVDSDLVAALGLFCFVANEVTALQRTYLAFNHDVPSDDVAKKIFNNHRIFILHTWSSKIYEIIDFLDLKGHNKTSNAVLSGLCSKAKVDLEKRGLRKLIPLVRDIRNEISNHVSLKAARKNISHLDEDSDLSFYLHEMEGNSFYAFGGEIVFSGRLNRALNQMSGDGKQERFLEWLQWNLNANSWMRSSMADFANEIVFKRFPDRYAEEKVHWVDEDFVGDIHNVQAPLLFQRD